MWRSRACFPGLIFWPYIERVKYKQISPHYYSDLSPWEAGMGWGNSMHWWETLNLWNDTIKPTASKPLLERDCDIYMSPFLHLRSLKAVFFFISMFLALVRVLSNYSMLIMQLLYELWTWHCGVYYVAITPYLPLAPLQITFSL